MISRQSNTLKELNWVSQHITNITYCDKPSNDFSQQVIMKTFKHTAKLKESYCEHLFAKILPLIFYYACFITYLIIHQSILIFCILNKLQISVPILLKILSNIYPSSVFSFVIKFLCAHKYHQLSLSKCIYVCNPNPYQDIAYYLPPESSHLPFPRQVSSRIPPRGNPSFPTIDLPRLQLHLNGITHWVPHDDF